MEATQDGFDVFPHGGASRRAGRAASARERERRGQHLLVEGARIRLDPGREPRRDRASRDGPQDPVRRRGPPVRAGARSRTPGRPARCIGRTGTQGRSGSAPGWAAPARTNPVRRRPSTSAASRSTPRTTRSTGPTSALTRSGSGTWTARAPLDPVHQDPRARKPPERGDDRPRGRQDLLDQPAHRPGPGWEPGRLLGTASTLFGSGAESTAEDNPIGVAIDTAAGKIYWTNLNSGTVRVGNLDGTDHQTPPQTLFTPARAERAVDRPHDESDLLGQLGVRLGDPAPSGP